MKPSDRYVVIPLPLLDAPGMALKVYAVLRSYADREGVAWPSRRAIASSAAVSVDSVDNAIRWLVAGGWIAVEARYSPEGDRTSNRFHVYGSPSPQVADDSPPPPPAKTPPPVAAKPVQELDPVELDPDELAPGPAARPPHGGGGGEPFALQLVAEPLTPSQVRARNDRIMDDYARWRAAQGHEPASGPTMTILRRAVRNALHAGISEATVKQGMADWTEHGDHPRSVAAFIDARARGRTPGQRPARESKAAMTRRVVAQLQALESSPVIPGQVADTFAVALPPTLGAMPR